MPDMLAGSTVRAIDTPPTVEDTQADSYTFTNTTFGIGTTGGTYNDCGVAFVAPTTGRVKIDYAALLSNTGTNGTRVAPVVREGGTVGSGTIAVASSDANAVTNAAQFGILAGRALLVEGLVAGSTYNVRLDHRVTAGTGTAQFRSVIVAPAT